MSRYQSSERRRLVLTGNYSDLSTAGDGFILFVVPVGAAKVEAIEWSLDDGGTTSGSTGITVTRVRAETDAAIAAESTIAHDATTLYATIDKTSLTNNELIYGDIVRIDLDTVTGGTDSAGLAVALILNVVED